MFWNDISQNASQEGPSESWVGFARAHPHARNVGYFRVGLHRPSFFASLPACRLSLSADSFSFTGKSRKRLKFFGFFSRHDVFGSTQVSQSGIWLTWLLKNFDS